MKSNSYMNRALRSRDPRFARVLGKLGYGVAPEKRVGAVPTFTDLDKAREEYRALYGRQPYQSWDIQKIREKIAAHEDAPEYKRRDMRAED